MSKNSTVRGSKVFGLILTLLLMGFGSAEGANFLEKFVQQSFVIPNILLKQNQKVLGDIDIEKLIEEMKEVRWEINNSGLFLAGSGETRTGAIYFVREKKVILNGSRSQFEPVRTMPVAALHEALGALGYVDENYEISSLLYLNTLNAQERTIMFPQMSFENANRRFLNLSRRTEDVFYAGTSVGGGGDGVAVQAKIYALIYANAICTMFTLKCDNIYEKILDAKIEIHTVILVMRAIEEVKGSNQVIRVPLVTWLNGNIRSKEDQLSIEQMEIVRQIIEMISQRSK